MKDYMDDEHDYHTMLKLPARMTPRLRKDITSYEASTVRDLDKRLAREIAEALVYLPKFDTTPEECMKFRRDNKEQLRKHIEWGLSQEHFAYAKHFSDALLDRCVEMEIALSDIRRKMKKSVDLNLPHWKAAFSFRCRGWGSGRPSDASSIFINFYPDSLEPTLEQAFASCDDFLGTSDQAMSVLNHFEDVVKMLNPDLYNGVVRKTEMDAERRTIMRVRQTANSAAIAAKQAVEQADMWLGRDKKWAVKWLKEQRISARQHRDERQKKAKEASDALDKAVAEFMERWGEYP